MNKLKLETIKENPIMQERAMCVGSLIGSVEGTSQPLRAGLEDTPWRVAKMYDELFSGYKEDASQILEDAKFADIPSDDIVLVKDIQFYSTCEHHMMPFFGKIHIAYIASEGNVVGISKIARVVEVYARRLQVQERMCKQIADIISTTLNARAVAVIASAEHTCMTARGIQKPGTQTVTATLSGTFRDDSSARQELYSLINLHN